MLIGNPLAALAKPPHGIGGTLLAAAIIAAGGDIRTARAVIEAVEPLIVEDVVARIVRDCSQSWQYTNRVHFTDGRDPSDGDPKGLPDARMAATGLNDSSLTQYWHERGIARSEVMQRVVVSLRDGSTLIGPWEPFVEPTYPGA